MQISMRMVATAPLSWTSMSRRRRPCSWVWENHQRASADDQGLRGQPNSLGSFSLQIVPWSSWQLKLHMLYCAAVNSVWLYSKIDSLIKPSPCRVPIVLSRNFLRWNRNYWWSLWMELTTQACSQERATFLLRFIRNCSCSSASRHSSDGTIPTIHIVCIYCSS